MSRYNGCMNYKAYRYNGCIIFSFESDEYIFHSVVTQWIVMQTPPSDVHGQSTTVYGFESDEYIFEMNGHVSLKYDTDCALLQSVQDEFFIEMNGHVSFKDDTEGLVLNHDVSKRSEPWGNWVVVS